MDSMQTQRQALDQTRTSILRSPEDTLALRQQQESNRTYADVLRGSRDSSTSRDLRAVGYDGKTCSKDTSSSILHEQDHVLHVSNFPELHDRAYRKEPIQSTELDDFWASNYGLPMPKQSFKVVDSAIWGAINILLGALKAVPYDWPGLKAVGMTGKSYILLQRY